MTPQLKAYWEERLASGQIFAYPSGRKEDVHFRRRGDDSAQWPAYVSKDALYNDYMAWADKRAGATMPMAELYRLLEPVLYIHGRDRHTSRFKVTMPIAVPEGGTLPGKVQVAFLRLPSIGVMRAHYYLVTGCGTASQREGWRLTVLENRTRFGR